MSDEKFRGLIEGSPSDGNETGYDALMQEVCVEWGYCGCIKDDQALHVDLFIPPDGPVSADQFVEWVFLADNLNPNLRPESHRKALCEAFVKHMGGNIVEAKLLRWRCSAERAY